MDHPETDTPPAANQIPEVATPPARTRLCSRFLSAWNSNPVQMRLMLISLVLYMADVITDTMLAKQYYNNGDYYWLGWTIGFVMAPPAVMNILLLVYDIDLLDIKLSLRKFEKCLLNFTCFVPPLIKYVEFINLLDGGKVVKESLKKKLHRWHLFEATFESLPQLCLQIYIILSTHEQVSVLKVITMVISLVAAVKAVVTYMYYDRSSTYNGSSLKLVILLIIWKVSELSVRVMVIGLFASVFKQWVLLPIGLHCSLAFCTVKKIGNDDVTEACLHIVTCIFGSSFPEEYWYLNVVNTALIPIFNFLMGLCCIIYIPFLGETSWNLTLWNHTAVIILCILCVVPLTGYANMGMLASVSNSQRRQDQ